MAKPGIIPANLRQLLRWAFGQTRGVRADLCIACLVGVLRVGASLCFVWLSKALIDAATGRNDQTDNMVVLSVALAALMLVEMGLQLVFSYLTNRAEVLLKKNLRMRIFSHLMHSPWYKKDRMHSGDLLNRLTEDIRLFSETLCTKVTFLVVTGVQLVGAFFLLAYLSLKLALCIICILPVFLLFSKIYVRRSRQLTSEIRQNESNAHAIMQEGLQHHIVVQSFENEEAITSRMDTMQDEGYNNTMQRTRISILSRMFVRMGFIGGFLTAFLWSVWHLRTGAITFGSMTAFLQLVARIQNPMQNIMNYVPSIIYCTASIERLMELTDVPGEQKGPDIVMQGPAGIIIDDLTFAYDSDDRKIFSHFYHDFAPGSRTVVMGETGVGKSTLIKLLLALLRPESGKIAIYNSDRAVEVSPSTRCNITYVPQGNSLLDGTIRENLLMGNPDATDADLREALYTANAEFVYTLPQQIDTPCGELGFGLSEGQAQRLAIARALLRRSRIMLMDEFNSSLDETTARTLLERLLASRPDCTIIFISHRPEIIHFCDEVLTLTRQ